MSTLDLTLDALATYRITRLVTRDDFPPALHAREAIVHAAYVAEGREGAALAEMGYDRPDRWSAHASEDENAPALAQLVTCRWCAGFWIGLGVVIARRAAPRAWAPLAKAFSFGAVAALAARLEP